MYYKPTTPEEIASVKAASKRWREANRMYIASKQKARYSSNKEAILAADRARYAKDPEKAVAKTLQWRELNRDKYNSSIAKYRAAKLDRIPPWANLGRIAEFYAEAQRLGLTVDHIIPLRGKLVSGLHVENNLQLLTAGENSSKCNRYEVEA